MAGGGAMRRFQSYRLHALDMEARKRPPRGMSPSMRAAWESIQRVHESRLDEAWEEIGRIAAGFSDGAAALVAEHYLFCEPWSDVAAGAGPEMSEDKCKKRAYAALAWLDEEEEEVERREPGGPERVPVQAD